MKFCDKLAKKRKENNLSQELLADKLKMSRQAISKWESGSSYPDMETIIKLCKILNCPISDLLDDDALGDMAPAKNRKFNIYDWIKDLLKFITKTYNMFCSMTFKEKIKCIIEMIIIVLLIVLSWTLIGSILRTTFINLLQFLPDKLYGYFINLLYFIYEIIGVALGFIIVIHLFKTRYLDYFVIIEDNDVDVRTKEEPIEENKIIKENKKGIINEKPKEKIIIRDPKHSSYSFINGFIKIIMFFIKLFLIFIGCFLIISFIFISFALFSSIFYLKNGLFFLGTFAFSLGCLGLNFMILESIYDIIFNRKYHFLRQFITFIASLLLIGFGIALSVNSYLKFDTTTNIDPYLKTTTEYVNMSNNLILMPNENFDIVVDNSVDNIKVEITELKSQKTYLFNYEDKNYKVVGYNYSYNTIDSINLFIELFKDKRTFNYNYETKIKVYISKKNLDIINNNINRYNTY